MGRRRRAPGDVIEKNTFATEKHGWAEDGVGNIGFDQKTLYQGLSTEIRERQMMRGCVMLTCTIRCTPARLARVKERLRVGHGPSVVSLTVGEAHPVRVVEGRRAPEGFGQFEGVIEIERPAFYRRAQRARVLGVL